MWSSVVRILGLIILTGMTACGGSGDDAETSAEVYILSPASDMVTTSFSEITISGNAGMRNAINYPDGSVSWYNSTNGTSGTASGSVFCFIGCMLSWEADVPLAIGTNAISVSYIDATDSITVTRTASASGRITTSGGSGVAKIWVHSVPGDFRAITDGSGYYSIGGLVAGSYTLTPQSPTLPNSANCLSFTPSSLNVTMDGTANLTGQDFLAAPASPCYSVSGRVTSYADPTHGIEGIHMLTKNAQGAPGPYTYTDAGGYYVLYPFANGTYTVTPEYCYWSNCDTFVPSSRTVTIQGADVSGQNFTR